MKLHTRDQAPKEGGQPASPQPMQKVCKHAFSLEPCVLALPHWPPIRSAIANTNAHDRAKSPSGSVVCHLTGPIATRQVQSFFWPLQLYLQYMQASKTLLPCPEQHVQRHNPVDSQHCLLLTMWPDISIQWDVVQLAMMALHWNGLHVPAQNVAEACLCQGLDTC